MEELKALDNFLLRYKKRTTLPSREEILVDIMKYDCYSDESVYSFNSINDRKKRVLFSTDNTISSNPLLRISMCILPKKRRNALNTLFKEVKNTSLVACISDKYSIDNTDLFFDDYQSFLNTHRFLKKHTSADKYFKKRNPFALKINGVPCSVDFRTSENEFLDMYATYIRAYLYKKLSDGGLSDVNASEFKDFVLSFISHNSFDEESCDSLTRSLDINITPDNVDKLKFISEMIAHSFEEDYSLDSFKRFYIRSKYLLDKSISFYDEIDSNLKRLVSFDECGRYERSHYYWVNRQIEAQMDLAKKRGLSFINESEFFLSLGAILISNKETLHRYLIDTKKVDSIKERIIDSYKEDKSLLDDEDRFNEFVSSFSDEELLLIRRRTGYSDSFPTSREQCSKILKSYSGYVISGYERKNEIKLIKKDS